MRQSWFNHLDKMITTVHRSAQPFWTSEELQQLFNVRIESARNLAIAIGRSKAEARNYAVEAGTLLAFLEEFSALICPAVALKKNRGGEIQAAQALFQSKLKNARRALNEATISRKTRDAFRSALESEIKEALLACLLQAQANFGEGWQEVVVEIINDQFRKQEAMTKPIRSKATTYTRVSENPQTFMDFGKDGKEGDSEI